MNANVKSALVIGALVVLGAAVGAGVFVTTSSDIAVWFVIGGIPLIIVGGIALYVRGVVSRGGTSEQQYVRKRARAVAQEFQRTVRDVNDLSETYGDWEFTADARLESVAGDFRAQGVAFDLGSGAFDLTKGVANADVQAFEELSVEVDRLEDDVEAEFRTFADDELSRLADAIDRLEAVDLATRDAAIDEPADDAAIPACRDAVDAGRAIADETIETAIDTVREMKRGGQRPDDAAAIEGDLDAAVDALDRHEYGTAVESVLEARDRLRDQFSGSFDAERDAVLALVDAVDAAGVAAHVDAEYLDAVDAVESAVTGMDSALDLSEVSRRRADLRRTCIEMVAAMERDLADEAQTLRRAELPPGYYTEPGIVDEDFVDELERIEEFDRFTDRWRDVAGSLADAVDTATTKAAVVDAYDDVAETIAAELEASGEVTDDDLPVRNAEEFLGLYYRRNESVELDPNVPVLRVGDVETNDLTVEIAYERGGAERTATLTLSGAGYDETATIATRVAGTTTFTDVPTGSYELSGTPGDDAFAPIERSVRVDGETTVSVEFAEQSLRERVCSDTSADMDDHLSELRPRLEELYDADGYVSTAMELPVRASHAPCLLAVWAESDGYDATETSDGEIVVFERDRLERELTNVVRYNLESGDRLPFDELERNFLTAPVPRSVIRDAVADLSGEHSVTTTDDAIEMK
ncbi:hypothetical protein [Natrinema salaciae]|uniref:Coiled-coil protein n=1 Tax=Natrinema salaciae TaxID=1186196 RepID=A0A1H9NPH7_9EURY|nr:hypothetical protein [Natrinema salaciae]SER37555.1 hypothetical protein SAMN04489841_3674 [Natrinema salaciae]